VLIADIKEKLALKICNIAKIKLERKTDEVPENRNSSEFIKNPLNINSSWNAPIKIITRLTNRVGPTTNVLLFTEQLSKK